MSALSSTPYALRSANIDVGPPFAHPAVPVRAHYLGTYTPLTCPDEYILSIRQLVDYYKYEIQYNSDHSSSAVPLIVNTQGWVKGLGEELLRAIEVIVEPTDLFDFQSLEETRAPEGWTTSPPYQTSQLPYDIDTSLSTQRVHTLEAAQVSPLQARYTPADLRVLSTLTYFYASLPSSSTGVKWDFSAPLSAQRPWVVDVSSNNAIDQIYIIGEGSEGVRAHDLMLALNGSIVALVDHEEETSEVSEVYVTGRPPPPAESSTILGLALIRAIRQLTAYSYQLQILTPLPPSELARCSAIIKNGAIELPLAGLLDWRNPSAPATEEPFLDRTSVEVVGGDRRRFRKNLMRKGM